MDSTMHNLDLLFEQFSEKTPIISDAYLQKCAKYFDLERMYRPPPRPPSVSPAESETSLAHGE